MVTPTDDYYAAHDGGSFAPAETATVATWKTPAFLENLAVDAEGVVFLTVYSHNRIDRYDPATHTTTTFAELPAPPMGLAFDASGVLGRREEHYARARGISGKSSGTAPSGSGANFRTPSL